jgi:hypothetical protein
MSSWLDAPFLTDNEESDSSYVSSSGSSSESEASDTSEASMSRKQLKKKPKIDASSVFAEMTASEQRHVSLSKDNDLYDVFNSRVRTTKDKSIEAVWRRIAQEHSVGSDLPTTEYRKREKTTEPLSKPLSEILKAVEHEFVEIEEDGFFAGKMVKITRKVSVYSEEARRFLKRQKRPNVSALDSYLETVKAKTVNAMEKTSADWSQFKESSGIREDLEVERKRGYLVDKAFLAKVQRVQDERTRPS